MVLSQVQGQLYLSLNDRHVMFHDFDDKCRKLSLACNGWETCQNTRSDTRDTSRVTLWLVRIWHRRQFQVIECVTDGNCASLSSVCVCILRTNVQHCVASRISSTTTKTRHTLRLNHVLSWSSASGHRGMGHQCSDNLAASIFRVKWMAFSPVFSLLVQE